MADWATETGLVTKFDGEVVDAWFEEGEYGVNLKLVFKSPQVDNDIEQWYSCGQKGVSFVSDKQVDISMTKNGRFNENTKVGQLIKHLNSTGLVSQIADKGGPDEAASWIGLRARFEEVEFGEFEGKPRKVVVPVGPYGGDDTPPASNDADEIPAWLVNLCAEHDTYNSFVEAALADERIDRSTRKLVMNESLWLF